VRFARFVGLVTASAVVASGLALAVPAAQAAAVAVEDGYTLSQIRTGINRPHSIRFAPDGRLFLLEQIGRVQIVKNGQLTTALTIDPAVIVEPGGSAGLLSIAFPPNFETADVQRVYLIYTHEPMPGYDYRHNVLSRFTIQGDVIDPTSEQILVHFDTLVGNDGTVKTMHYGGDMEFGADGKLYVTTGDLLIGPNAQNLQNRYGKILRYNADGSIPPDNPFYNTLTGRLRAIWSYGLRNPFKLTYDDESGDMLIGDVGSSTWEEVNLLPAGEPAVNFGWSVTEGYTSDPRFRTPLLAYPHDPDLTGPGEPYGCAVMGGDVYRPNTSTFPAGYAGDYFFADHCQGWLRSIDPATGDIGPVLVTGLELPVDMAVAPNGAVWIIQRQLNGRNNGVLYRLQYTGLGDAAPKISGQPESVTVAAGMSADFEVFASGTDPLAYQWFKDGIPLSGETDPSLTLSSVQLADDGAEITVRVTNDFGNVTSDPAVLSVLDDEPPVPTITSPGASKKFAGGDRLRIRGTATDLEDGELPASAFEWEVELHHNTHSHPEFGPVAGDRSVHYDVPRAFETDPDIFLRIILRVTDSDGVTTEVTRDVQPKLSDLRFETLPGGRSLIVDGSPIATPLDLQAVVGILRSLGAPTTTVDGVGMQLDSWENGSTVPSRSFWAPARDHLYRAFYRVSDGSVGTGSGLSASYFGSSSFTNLLKSRVDRVPYFTWGTSRPAKGVPADNFSVRWEGEVQGQFGETYTLSVPVAGDSEVRVEVGGVTVIDTFASGETGTVTGSFALAAGETVPITIEYSDGTGAANLALQWSSTSTPTSAIPGSQLYPAAG
jgi:glucose/arabinose dehydrogenase